MPKQVLDQIFSFLYPIYPMHVRLKQGPESHDIQFSAEVIEYISRIQEVAESRIEITDLSIIDKIMDQLAAQKILPHKFLTGRGMLNDGSLSRNRRKADEKN